MPYSDPKRQREYQALYRSIHREKAKEAGARWRAAHPEYQREYGRKYGWDRGLHKPKVPVPVVSLEIVKAELVAWEQS